MEYRSIVGQLLKETKLLSFFKPRTSHNEMLSQVPERVGLFCLCYRTYSREQRIARSTATTNPNGGLLPF